MDQSLESIFSSQVYHADTSAAIDFIRSIDSIMPSETVLREVIFKILMEVDDIRCLALSSDYLITTLNVFPPNNDENRKFYYDSIRDSHGYLDDLWLVFSHIVNSYFYHRSIYGIEKGENRTKPIKYPNCKFLLEFYVKLFAVDFQYLYTKSFSACLVMRLLWPNNMFLSNRTDVLLKWINDIYNNPSVNNMGDLLRSMHKVLTLMIKCIVHGKHHLTSDVLAFNHPCLTEIVEATVNFCKNAFANQATMRLFLSSLRLKYFQIRVCEKIIKQIIKLTSKRTIFLTLSDIISMYMFPQKFNKLKNSKPSVNIEKNLRKRVPEKKSTSLSAKKTSGSFSDKKMETTELHELCKENKFGDLLEALKLSYEDINSTDHSGSTPLHEACQASNHMCVRVLINESAKASGANLDFTAANLEGLTPLHLAVKSNSIEIARVLLSAGGSDLLAMTDNRGYCPSDLSTSEEMDKLLQENQSEISSNESDSTTHTESSRVKEAPSFKSFREYSIYLQAITCLLCNYFEMFNLYNFIWKKNSILVQSHSDKICSHFYGDVVCSEDASIVSEMPGLVDTFIESVDKHAKKRGFNIDIELIPLKAFSASLKPS